MKNRNLCGWLLLPVVYAIALHGEPAMLLLREDEPGQAARVVWSTDPGIRYELQESEDLEHWTTVEGFPSEAQALAQQYIIMHETAGERRFFRVRSLDEQAPAITRRTPGHGAFGVRRFSPITIELDDITGVDPNSIIMTVGGHGTFTLADDELSYDDGTLVFDLGGDTALGGWGAVINVALTVADILGNEETHEWAFDLEIEPVVADNIFVFGSPTARRAGQELGAIPTRVLSDRMIEGPVRMNAGAEPWELHSVEPDRIVISYTGDNPPVLFNVGDRLCNLTPATTREIFYRQCTGIADDPGRKMLTIHTEDLSLEDIIEEGTISTDDAELYFEISEDGVIGEPFPFSADVALNPLGYSSDGLSFSLKSQGQDIFRVTAEELHWWLTPSLRTGLEIRRWRLRRFEAAARGDLKTSMVFDVEVCLLGAAAETTVFSIPSNLRPSFWVPLGSIGPVPVSAKVEFNLELLAQANAGAVMNFRTGLRKDGFAEFGINYEHSREPSIKWIWFNKFNSEIVPLTLDIDGEMSLKLKLKPSVSLLVYRLAGLEASVAPSAGPVFSVGAQGVSGRLEADVSLELAPAGPALAWLNPKPTLSYTIWGPKSWHLFPTLNDLDFIQHPRDVTLTVGDRLELSAEAHSLASSSITYEWYMENTLIKYDSNSSSGSRFVIDRVNSGHAGEYRVRAIADGKRVWSDPATVTVTSASGPGGDYMVIDLSAGPSASSYPVSYLSAVPPGGWTDEYKTTKLVMRRIPAGTFTMGSPPGELGRSTGETQRQVTLTKDYYMGAFQVTQKQWERVMGDWPSWFNNTAYRDSRPLERRSWNDIRGGTWPGGQSASGTFMQRVSDRTGLAFDLPTEAQWEYAARAGTITALNSGKNLTTTDSCPNMARVGRYGYNHPGGYSSSSSVSTDGGTAKVGSYLPNAWGLYDMHGNVYELCLDWHTASPTGSVDPAGAASGLLRVLRGGSWGNVASNGRSASRSTITPAQRDFIVGFRLSSVLP